MRTFESLHKETPVIFSKKVGNMGENKAIKLVAFLLVATLITTSVVSEVFAKYTSRTDSGNMARAAQYGIIVSAEGKLFNQQDESGNQVINVGDKSPGNGLTLALNGVAEVNGEISFSVDYQNIFLGSGDWGIIITAENVAAENYVAGTYYVLEGDTYKKEENDATFDPGKTYYLLKNEVSIATSGYWPVVFKMTGTGPVGYVENEATATKVNTLEGVVNTLSGALDSKKTFIAAENLSNIGLISQSIMWEWNNCRSNCDKNEINIVDGEITSVCDVCKADTILQNLLLENNAGTIHVVKKDSAMSYKVPTAATSAGGYTDGDYNLYAAFNFNLAVRQTD
jgi:hypothetical protein